MKIMYWAGTLVLGAALLTPAGEAAGRELFSLRRVRTVPNPAPELRPGEEMLEITFYLRAPSWVRGVGWTLRYYDGEMRLLGTETEALIDPGRNPLSRIRGRAFRGATVFSLLFPLREDAEYMVLALGDGARREVTLIPYTALLEDFGIPAWELDAEISRSRLLVLPD